MTSKQLKIAVRLYRAYIIIAVAAVLLGVMAYRLFKGYSGRREVGDKLNEIKQTTVHNERRADEIIDAAKSREEAVRDETAQSISSVSDDGLPDLLAGLLSDWRHENRR